MLHDISYQDYSKRGDIHGTVLYPATMIAPVQKDIISDILENEEIHTIFDPFCGSGTALFEALQLDENLRLTGFDINPLAHMITTAKLEGVDSSIYSDIAKLEVLIEQTKPDDFTFENIDKWFREDIAADLRRIRINVSKIKSTRNRRYLWCMYSNIIRKYSNSRSSTYKLHVKQEEKIQNMNNKVIEDFIFSTWNNIELYQYSAPFKDIRKCNTITEIKKMGNRVIDMSITSPPYGDNATTVPYGQFSSLALRWIDDQDLILEGWEKDNYSIIDRMSLGGRHVEACFSVDEQKLIDPYLDSISEGKKKKVSDFFVEYFEFLEHFVRVTDKYIIMTLGNRTVDKININLTEITIKYLELHFFKNIQVASRGIPQKRIPKKTSQVDNEPVSSMNLEYVIIHKRVDCNPDI